MARVVQLYDIKMILKGKPEFTVEREPKNCEMPRNSTRAPTEVLRDADSGLL